MELHELVYVSLATQEMPLVELTAMLDQAREKNRRMNITGMLVYHDGDFMQLLEGNRADILDLYDTICQDTRNKLNYLMWQGPIAQRSFGDWSMAFLEPGELLLGEKPAYSTFLQHGLSLEAMATPQNLGKQFLVTLRDDFLRTR